MANYNLDVKTLAQLMRQAALSDHSLSFDWQAQFILDRLESMNGAHTNLADITAQKIAQLKREEHFGIQDAYAGANPEPFPCSKDYDTDGQEGESYRDDYVFEG